MVIQLLAVILRVQVMNRAAVILRVVEQVENLLAEYAPLLADAETADGAISL